LDQPRVVVIGASAGGIDALIELIPQLPADFRAPICIVVHMPATSPSLLARILARNAKVKVVDAADGARLKNGVVYVAQPDRHLVIESGHTLRLVHGPRENRHRPSADPLFRSAASAYGSFAVGVILTGALDDGTAGMLAIKRAGGMAVVQDPDDSLYPGMPQSALENVGDIDFIVPLSGVAAALEQCLDAPRTSTADARPAARAAEPHGQPSAFSCPDCGGVLREVVEGEYHHFRCRVGHALSPNSLLGAQSDGIEEALWSALKTLEESAELAKRLAATERERGHAWMVKRFENREREALDRAATIRSVLAGVSNEVPVETAP
jgi:two-component system, chemotaxis family, protein-glutamate methylesterase/glutaminase